MFNAPLNDGSQLFDYLLGPHATVVVTPGGARSLVRADGYVTTIGREQVREYAGQRTKLVSVDLKHVPFGHSG
jgi:hypothetical protein